MIVLGVSNTILSVDSFQKALKKEDDIKISLLSKMIRDYIRGPLLELNIIKENLESTRNTSSEDFNKLLGILTENSEKIWSIQVSDLYGNIRALYPNDERLLGTDISGHEYFKIVTHSDKPYWSSTFLSSKTNSSAVTLSKKYSDGVITLFISIKEMDEILALLNGENSRRLVFVTDQRGVYVYHPDYRKVLLRENNLFEEKQKEYATYNNEKYYIKTVQMPETGWQVSLYTPMDNIYQTIYKLVLPLIIILISLISIAIIIGRRFSKTIYNGINALLNSTREIALGEYDITIRPLALEEMDLLAKSVTNMSKVILERETELKDAYLKINNNKVLLEREVEKQTKDLRSALESLNDAQEKVIESEKLASLGGMVAGVAHEINTPIGIIVTAASYLQDKTEELYKSYQENTMAKSMFSTYCENVLSTTSLILSNSKRSSNLISSFKQVAVDQSSEEVRVFRMKKYINEILTSLHPNFKKTTHIVEVNCDESITVKSYPGAIAQILTNLILNSIKHGFENIPNGVISIDIYLENERIHFIYKDNGKGMSPEEVKKIYDPFFTTKRGKGGSGLGMHIVYNLVTQKLGGQISCTSSKNNGTTFLLDFPSQIV